MAHQFVHAVLHGAVAADDDGPQPMDPSTKLVYVVIAEHANIKTGLAWPSVGTIARLTCLNRTNVSKHIAKLVADEWIGIVKGGKGGRPRKGSGFSTVYLINVEKLHALQNHRGGAAVSPKKNRDAGAAVSEKTMMPAHENRSVQKGNHDAGAPKTMTPAQHKPEVEPLSTGSEPGAASPTPNNGQTARGEQPRFEKGNGSPEAQFAIPWNNGWERDDRACDELMSALRWQAPPGWTYNDCRAHIKTMNAHGQRTMDRTKR